MNIYLAGTGWIADAPAGNRLRWHYPVDAVDANNQFLGLPHTIIVERACVQDVDMPDTLQLMDQVYAPFAWWEHLGSASLSISAPAFFHLPKTAQAIRFQYNGALAATIDILDGVNDQLVARRSVQPGDWVSAQGPAIDQVRVLAYFGGTLDHIEILDLFADHGLDWEIIAEIRVRDSLGVSLADAATRSNLPPTMSTQEWNELRQVGEAAQTTAPGDLPVEPDDEPTPWETFNLLLGLRWEHALLAGHGFFDGPHTEQSALDAFGELLETFTTSNCQAFAYRVREAEPRVGDSNIVVCPPFVQPGLIPPQTPTFTDAVVVLRENLDTHDMEFIATYDLDWVQSPVEKRSLGVEVAEQFSASATSGASATVIEYASRSSTPETPPNTGSVAREQVVSFHDVTVRARARAIDAWDRVSPYSGWSPQTPLALIHEPPAPRLRTAQYEGGTVRIRRWMSGPADNPVLPDWSPDVIVLNDPTARVTVYRRHSLPATTSTTVSQPVPIGGGRFRTTVGAVPGLNQYLGGTLIAGGFKAPIVRIDPGNLVYVDVIPGGDTTSAIFPAGSAQLHQNPEAFSLWSQVAQFNVQNLPEILEFPNAVPGPGDGSDVLHYLTRITFLGQAGPPSNTVHAIRIAPTPVKPPPFTVEVLGIDFYNRTMIKVTLDNPESGAFTIWWASGTPGSGFKEQSVPGEYGAQAPLNGLHLYDVLSLPIPQNGPRTVTIGVQRVNGAGGQSGFETVPVTLYPPIP